MKALEIYRTSRGEETRRYYAALQERGPLGVVAMNLFRAQKCSSRAKKYHGGIKGVGSYRNLAYGRKGRSLEELGKALLAYPELAITFGWKRDPGAFHHAADWVLYVDLPQGQVSFHSTERFAGPDYPGDWDRQRRSEERILAFCDSVFDSSLSQLGLAPTLFSRSAEEAS